MVRALNVQDLKKYTMVTHEGASAYDYSASHPLIHLTFTKGSALLTDGFYTTQEQEVRELAEALMGAWRVEPRFPWQYGAWMRDPKRGKGNRIQGSLVPALLDAVLDETAWTEEYVGKCLSHRPDDAIAFVQHYAQLGLGAPSAAARRGLALALASFDEYQLMKYTNSKGDVRLCDVIYMVRDELEALGERAALVRAAGAFLHAPTRRRAELVGALPVTAARRRLFTASPEYALEAGFAEHVAAARVTWEQIVGHFAGQPEGDPSPSLQKRRRAVWRAILGTPGLLPDMALLRNLRNLRAAGFTMEELCAAVEGRPFRGIWPHQIYAGYKAERELEPAFSKVLAQAATALLPPGRHLGIGDISGSMGIRVGGVKGTTTAMDVSLCFVGLMSETSGLGASFDSGIHVAQRAPGEGPLAFTRRREINAGWGSTQVFGAVMELIQWLKRHDDVEPPTCLWFFSDMQFHPAATGSVPAELADEARRLGVERNAPPLEIAMHLYRKLFGPVRVVLWNLAAYAPVPVPSDMDGVLLVSGFDANTFRSVGAWLQGEGTGEQMGKVEDNQEVILDLVRTF